MALSPVDFFSKADRGAQKSASSTSAEGSLSKKSAKGAAGRESVSPFARELDSAKKSTKDSVSFNSNRSSTRTERLGDESSMPTTDKSKIKYDEPSVRNFSEPKESQASVGPRQVPEARISDARNADKSVLKEQAVLDFMTEMHERFGVEPDDIVSAFASMDPETLKGRPEDAMAEFLAALQIPPQQIPDAAKLYQKLVNETGQSALNEQMGDSGKSVNMNVIGASDYKKMQLNDSLDTMSNRFFRHVEDPAGMPGQSGTKPLGQEWDALGGDANFDPNAIQDGPLAGLEGESSETGPANTNIASKQADAEKSDSKKSGGGLMGGLAGILGSATVAAGAVASATANGTKAPGMSATTTPEMSANPTLGDSSAINSLTETSVEDGADLTGDSGAEGSLGQSASGAGAAAMGAEATVASGAAMFAAAAKAAMSESGEKKKDGAEGDAAASGLAAAGLADTQRLNSHTGKTAGPEAMMAAQPQITPEQKQENIQELIRNAQVIMRKGGGEMKMQLKPEGIGQVNLRVLVQDGQVNVQMITENDGAKKLLENGLSELKSQLATHKLHVETLKVDVAGEAAKQKFEHGQSDAQRDHARQFASDFLGNFRDDRQAFRQEFFGDFGNRAYNRSQKRDSMKPAPVEGSSAPSSVSNQRRSEGSRRLNLVA